MPSPVLTRPFMMISAEKDVLLAAVRNAPDSREKTAIIAAVTKSSMADGEVHLTRQQLAYLQQSLPGLIGRPELAGSKYQSETAATIAQGLAKRCGTAAQRA